MFEIGAARGAQKTVYGWKIVAATIPQPLQQITDYTEFNPESKSDVSQMLQKVKEVAQGYL